MSEYGADPVPDEQVAFDLIVTKGFLPKDKTNVMQWSYPDGNVMKIANRQDKSNMHFKMAPVVP